jgi:hypothetical protein
LTFSPNLPHTGYVAAQLGPLKGEALHNLLPRRAEVPCGRKRKLRKIATHKRKKKLRKNRHKNK